MSLKTAAVALAVLLTAVGSELVGTGPLAASPADVTAQSETAATTAGAADVEAAYANGSVTVTITQGGEPVPDATVEVAGEEYITDADGTVFVEDADLAEELTVEVEAPGFEGEVEYTVADGSLTLAEGEFDYESEADERESEDDGDEEADDEDEEETDDEYEDEEMEDKTDD